MGMIEGTNLVYEESRDQKKVFESKRIKIESCCHTKSVGEVAL